MRRSYRFRGRVFVPRDQRLARQVQTAAEIRKALSGEAHTKDTKTTKEIQSALQSPTQPELFS